MSEFEGQKPGSSGLTGEELEIEHWEWLQGITGNGDLATFLAELEIRVMELEDPISRVSDDDSIPRVSDDRIREALVGFFDYYAPSGGISDVPLGPFERAAEALGVTVPEDSSKLLAAVEAAEANQIKKEKSLRGDVDSVAKC